MGLTEGPCHCLPLGVAEAGPREIHPQLYDTFVEAGIHRPQILQHLEIEYAEIVELLRGKRQCRDIGKLKGPGLLEPAGIGHQHRRPGQGASRQSLVRPRCRRIKLRAVQRHILISQRQRKHPGGPLLCQQQRPLILLYHPAQGGFRGFLRRRLLLQRLFPGHAPSCQQTKAQTNAQKGQSRFHFLRLPFCLFCRRWPRICSAAGAFFLRSSRNFHRDVEIGD